MSAPRFQFTIKGLLWATFLTAASVAAGSLAMKAADGRVQVVGFIVTFVGSGFAMGSLCKRPKTGLAIGAAAALLVFLVLGIMVYNAHSHSYRVPVRRAPGRTAVHRPSGPAPTATNTTPP